MKKKKKKKRASICGSTQPDVGLRNWSSTEQLLWPGEFGMQGGRKKCTVAAKYRPQWDFSNASFRVCVLQ